MILAFDDAKGSPEAARLAPEQLEYIESRLKTIKPRATQRKIRLQYLEHKVR